jgi:cation diffusion facilitator family transporter
MESIVNLSAAFLALFVIRIGVRPPDDQHAYGHEKVEYFSSGAEGGMILIAALSIIIVAIQRLLDPRQIQSVDVGIAISVIASLINLVVSLVLMKAGRRFRSIALQADAKHLMTDVWTSAGVVLGVGLVALTGWQVLDPAIAIAVAIQIGVTGVGLMRRSTHGLMDAALPESDVQKVLGILAAHLPEDTMYHALRTRQSGARSFVSMHIQVPGDWSVQKGHDLAEAVEQAILKAIPMVTVFTHIEPREDPVSWADEHLDRPEHHDA